MRNFVAVVIGIIVLSVFIGFNYVVWDREQVISNNSIKDTTIRTLSGQISELNFKNQNLNDQILTLEKEVETLKEDLSLSAEQSEEMIQEISEKDTMIQNYKKQIDRTIFKDIIELWASLINDGKYEEAYRLQATNCDLLGEIIHLDEFDKIFKNVSYKINILEVILNDTVFSGTDYNFSFHISYEVDEPSYTENGEEFLKIAKDHYNNPLKLKAEGVYFYKIFPVKSQESVIRTCHFEYDESKGIWMISSIK